MLVRDFYAQAKRAFEGCDEAAIFSRLTDAIKLLSNKGLSDPQVGELSLCVCNGCITLPRDVGTVLGVLSGGFPTLLQDQWYQYHINGPGSTGCVPISPNAFELGQVCTLKDFSEAAFLTAEVTNAADNNKKLRVFALDTSGHKVFTPGPDGKMYEGFLVPLVFGYPSKNPQAPAISSIYRITKDPTKDIVKLYGLNATDDSTQTLVGYYEPEETTPQYRRIRVGNKNSVRIRYKKASLQITRMSDWINCDNFEALRIACRAVKFRDDDKFTEAKTMEDEATRILSEDIESQRPSGPRVPQIIIDVYQPCGQDGLFYNGGG